MAARPAYATKSGRMSKEEHASIERLAQEMKTPTAGKIARRLNRHPATVKWFMLTRGLIERAPQRAAASYTRNGRVVHPYLEQHDMLIEQLRAQGKVFREIAAELTTRFGIDRTAHSIQVRLVQLSADPNRETA